MSSFEAMIKNLEEEIIALKTATIKSAVQIATSITSTTYTFNFYNNSTVTMADKLLQITATPINNIPMIAECTIQAANFSGREINIDRSYGGNNSITFTVYAYGNQNDRDIISGGGTATATYTFDITSTAPIALTTTEIGN